MREPLDLAVQQPCLPEDARYYEKNLRVFFRSEAGRAFHGEDQEEETRVRPLPAKPKGDPRPSRVARI